MEGRKRGLTLDDCETPSKIAKGEEGSAFPGPQTCPKPLKIESLPTELLENILQYSTYTQLTKIRLVNRQFKEASDNLLNRGFHQTQLLVTQRLAKLKDEMPRRESARHKHPLARECDIFRSINIKLCLLRINIWKYVRQKSCCFFPGQILDEIRRIQRYVQTTKDLDYAYIVTTELSDLSHMAIDFFRDHILPTLVKKENHSEHVSPTGDHYMKCLCGSCNMTLPLSMKLDQREVITSKATVPRIRHPPSRSRLQKRYKQCRRDILSLQTSLKHCVKVLKKQFSKTKLYERHVQEQNRQIEVLTKELEGCKAEIRELKGLETNQIITGSSLKKDQH